MEEFRLSVLRWQILALLLPAGLASGQPAPDNSATPEPPASAPLPQAGVDAPSLAPDAPQPEEPKAGKALKVSYDKGIVFATEDGELRAKLGVRTQLRFESTRPTERGAEVTNRIYIEVRGAFNWYWEGHRWKWATDVGLLKQTGRDAAMVTDDPDLQLRSMAQLTF